MYKCYYTKLIPPKYGDTFKAISSENKNSMLLRFWKIWVSWLKKNICSDIQINILKFLHSVQLWLYQSVSQSAYTIYKIIFEGWHSRLQCPVQDVLNKNLLGWRPDICIFNPKWLHVYLNLRNHLSVCDVAGETYVKIKFANRQSLVNINKGFIH